MNLQRIRRIATVLVLPGALAALAATPAGAQATADPPASTWHWHVDANTVFGFNDQHRKFRDFSAWESQNWLMASGQRRAGSGAPAAARSYSRPCCRSRR